ncbi:hypothetical protein QP028_11160 [Corynebacterium suedekumii]|nr:hypothetical protein QP028_11160 [Corynebacterium suedekumii]
MVVLFIGFWLILDGLTACSLRFQGEEARCHWLGVDARRWYRRRPHRYRRDHLPADSRGGRHPHHPLVPRRWPAHPRCARAR